MSKALDLVEAQAAALPAAERAELAERLLQGLTARPDEVIERAWVVEAHRRLDEICIGKVTLVGGEDGLELVRRLVGR
jgi:putative addiction module component (TIGR02574 family)